MTELGANTLSELLSGGVFVLFLILARVGTAVMFLPGFGDLYISPTKRFLLSLCISFVLMPVLWPLLPKLPGSVADLLALYASELFYGLFVGILARILLMALDVAGFMIASNAGLSAATSFNPQMSSSGPIITSFLTLSAILVMFAMNTHHLMIQAILNSYEILKPGVAIPTEDMAMTITEVTAHSFRLGFQLAAPFIILGLVFNVGLGLLARLVPQMQVFLVGVPLQILMGLAILAIVLMSLLQLWLGEFQQIYIGLFS